MRGLHQTIGRGRRGAWIGLVLVVVAAGSPTARARPPAAPELAVAEADPIDLAADRIRAWEADGVRWAVLTGRAAVLQGTEGVRAESVVVRIAPRSGAGPEAFDVQVYAEGRVLPTGSAGPPREQFRIALRTEAGVKLRPYRAEGLVRAPGPPADSALMRRAFPGPATATPPRRSVAAEPLRPAPGPQDGPVVALGEPIAEPDEAPALAEAPGTGDPDVRPAQFTDEDAFPTIPGAAMPEPGEAAPADALPDALNPEDLPVPLEGPEAEPGPGAGPEVTPPAGGDAGRVVAAPIAPGTQRVVNFYPRDGGPDAFAIQTLPTAPDGTVTVVITGGVTVVANALGRFGTIDVSADHAIVWYRRAKPGRNGAPAPPGAEGAQVVQDADEPMEIYLEGNVNFRQDKRQVAGNSDQLAYKAQRFYCDLRTERYFGLEAELEQYAPGFVAPIRTEADQILQFRPVELGPDGKARLGLAQIQAESAVTTGSRFARPGYRFFSRTVDLFEQPPEPLTEPNSGRTVGRRGDPNSSDTTYLIDARQNFFFLGPVPVFYWPRILTTSEDIDPPLRQVGFRVNNYFGQQLLTDWNGFKLFGLKKPKNVDNWNFDIDYLSYRGVALGSEIGYFGGDLSSDVLKRDLFPNLAGKYFGYLDFWGLVDEGNDFLG
ncbi:MAG TPA: hypothetical protein VF590_01800, partial [Isosphaeraceae bacterium]